MNIDKQPADDDHKWNQIYLAVVIYSIIVIVGIWLFSKMF